MQPNTANLVTFPNAAQANGEAAPAAITHQVFDSANLSASLLLQCILHDLVYFADRITGPLLSK